MTETLEELENCLQAVFPGATARPGQLETALQIIEALERSDIKHVVLDAPTGSGKSLIAMVVAEYLARNEKRTLITTVTKSLQDQYLRDYSLADLRSSANEMYRCGYGYVRSDLECKKTAIDKECYNVHNCPYKRAARDFFRRPKAMTNIQFVSNIPFTGSTYLTVIDECHELASVVISQVELKWPELKRDLLRFVIHPEDSHEKFENLWKEATAELEKFEKDEVVSMPKISAAVEAFIILDKYLEEFEKDQTRLVSIDTFMKRAYGHAKTLSKAIQTLVRTFGSKFVAMGDNTFKPIYASDFTAGAVFNKSTKTLHMSATVCGFDAYCEEVGIDPNEAIFIETSHIIPVSNRQITIDDVAWMSYKNYDSDIIKTAEKIDALIEQSNGENTIIHTASYKRAEDIASISKYEIQVPRKHPDVIAALKKKNSFVASPSVMAGIDAKDDMCRLNIICKLPYPSLADPRMKYLMNMEPRLYMLGVVRNIVQASGRGTRHENDWSKTYIIDGNIHRLLREWGGLFPTWFLESIS